MIRLTITAKGDLKALRPRLNMAVGRAAEIVATTIGQVVHDKIPRSDGWYGIYKEAIRAFSTKDGLTWAVSGEWPVRYSTPPADTTLVIFEGATPVAKVLMEHNPWPIDLIPQVSGGYRMRATARAYPESQVDFRRAVLLLKKDFIHKELERAGASIQANEFPTVNGRIYADIAWMADALEHGLAGFPRTPHWASAYQEARKHAGAWIERERPLMAAILAGDVDFSSTAVQIPADLKRALP
mgnify:CR=1 FL=1